MFPRLHSTVLTLSVLVPALAGCSFELSYTRDELQSALQQHFPLHFSVERVGAIELVEPRIELSPGSERIGFDVGIFASVHRLPSVRVATLGVSSKLVYEAESAQFFAVEPRFEELAITGLGDSMRSSIESLANQALPFLDRIPLYRLDDDSAARRYLEKVEVRDEQVVLTLGLL